MDENKDVIVIQTRRDYELYIKMGVGKMPISNKMKSVVRQAIMNGFDDGVAFKENKGLSL